jgi:uncharacterized RDD family membrane protein YckC
MTELDPYAAPRADITDLPAAPDVFLTGASAGARVANVIVDLIACQVLSRGMRFGLTSADVMLGPLQSVLFYLAVRVGYYVAFEAASGATLGKLITGTRVVCADGRGKPSLGQIIGRTFIRFVPFDAFSFLGSSTGGWHDRWSGTLVVRVRGER